MTNVFETLFLAARYGNLETIQMLHLSPLDLFQQDEEGNTALHMASANGHLDIVQFLLFQCPKMNGRNYLAIQNQHGNTPLHWAAANGHKEIVCELVKGGADLHIKNNAQKTPLWEAEFHGQTSVVTWLLEHTDIALKNEDDTIEL